MINDYLVIKLKLMNKSILVIILYYLLYPFTRKQGLEGL